MTDTNRRDILTVAAAGALAVGLTKQADGHTLSGPMSNATVTFGEWKTDPPLDRWQPFAPPTNDHHVLPYEVTIRAGGAVNFVIAGFHLLLIFDTGKRLTDVRTDILIPGPPVPLIADPNQRIYRGLDPRTQPLDRVEAVGFNKPGTYLFICGVLPHFVDDNMHGWVRVLP